MRTASSQRRTTNWVTSIVLAIFLARAAGFTVVRAVILLGQVSPSGTFASIVRYNRSGAFTLDAPRHRFDRVVGHPELGTWPKGRLVVNLILDFRSPLACANVRPAGDPGVIRKIRSIDLQPPIWPPSVVPWR
jgi:hypothetical protein